MASDVRIQLEGRLEKVERAARTWEKVAQSLRGETWRGGALFDVLAGITADVEATVQEVRRKAGGAPETQAALARLERAQAAVRDRALARLRRVGATPVDRDTLGLLTQLREEYQVVHQERLGWSLVGQSAMMTAMFAGLASLTLLQGQKIWPLPLIPAVLIPAVAWLQSTRVLVTARTLVLDGTAVPLSDIVQVRARVANVPNRRGKQCEIEVYARNRPVLRVSSAGRPTAMIHALEGRGVRCEVETNWGFLW